MNRVLPILFNTEMVRAILDGRKTVTRRLVKNLDIEEYGGMITLYEKNEDDALCVAPIENAKKEMLTYCQYQPGDTLYVRETWQYLHELDGNEQVIEETGRYYYAATDTLPDGAYVDSVGRTHERIHWRPSIHMPKEAARIWLRCTDVRAEQLQEITMDGMLNEGVIPVNITGGQWQQWQRDYMRPVWNSTIKKPDLDRYGWEVNPYVFVIEFERCEKPD